MKQIALSAPVRSVAPLFLYLFVLALVGVLSFPIRALLITQVLNGSSFENGLTFAIPAILSVFLTPILGSYSDTLADRRRIVSFGLLWMALGSLAVGFSVASWQVVLVSSLIFPVFASVNAQYFAWAKEREIQKFGEKATGSGELRVGYVAGWVFGPAAGGALIVVGFSYHQLFQLQAIGFAALAGAIWLFASHPKTVPEKGTEKFRWANWRDIPQNLLLIGLFVAFVLAGDIVRLANLALFINANVSQSALDLTLVFSATPVVELPATMACIWAAKRFSEKGILAVGIIAGIIYFSLSPFATSITQLIILQGLYALIPASALGIGINYAQNCAPNRLGFATSIVFAGQSLAILIGGVLAAIGGFALSVNSIYFLPLIFCLASILIWLKLPKG